MYDVFIPIHYQNVQKTQYARVHNFSPLEGEGGARVYSMHFQVTRPT